MKRAGIHLAAALIAVAVPLAANDVTFLNGVVQMADGSAPGKSVEIQLSCGGAEPSRQTTTNKKGEYNLKVERDEFNHVARPLPSTTMDMSDARLSGPSLLLAAMKGFESNQINLSNFTIGKDMALPKLVLKAGSPAKR
jgi:hypothetical protein